MPRHTRVLFPSLAAVQVQRPDERTLVLTPRGGYLARPVDTLFRDRSRSFRRGERVELSDVIIEVTKIAVIDEEDQVEIAAKLRCAVEHASLSTHQQALHLVRPGQRKGSEYRAPGPAALRSPGSGPTASPTRPTALAGSGQTTPAMWAR
jgi:hypothetical protein